MKEKKFIKFLGYPIVIVDIAIYFILSYVFVDGFQNNILTILVNGALLFIGAMIATTAMMNQGLLSGGETEKYKSTLEAHLKQKQKIYSKLNKLQPWLDYNYQELLKIGRSVYISSAGYDYDKVYTASGKFISSFKVDKPKPLEITKKWQKPFKPLLKLNRWVWSDDWKLYREQKRYIKKAKRYKISRLTVSDLMNIDAGKDPNNFGITEKQYIAKETGGSALSRLVFSCFLPCISWGFVGFNMQTFLTQLVNIGLILMTALFSMFCAFSFKVKTHRNTIIKKINKMEEFDNSDFEIKETVEEKKDDGICSEKPVHAETDMVEKV